MSTENAIYNPPADFASRAKVSGMDAYQALCKKADQDYEGYWAEHARRLISWKNSWTKTRSRCTA